MPALALDHALVRILKGNHDPSGGGVLIPSRHILTCAHVVATALGLPEDAQDMPEQLVDFDFPLLPGSPLQAKVFRWIPVKDTDIEKVSDIALLELTADLPPQADPASLMPLERGQYIDRDVHMYGSPQSMGSGDRLDGTLKGMIENGRVQVENIVGRRNVTDGFSGTPVWDKEAQAVVGIIDRINARRIDNTLQIDNVAYMIPVAALFEAIPEIKPPAAEIDKENNPYLGLDFFRTEDQDRFFGRDKAAKDLLQLVQQHRFVTLIGASGSGKSSLLYAGLLPRLPDDWTAVVFRPNNQPFAELASAYTAIKYPDLSDEDREAKSKKLAKQLDPENAELEITDLVKLLLKERHISQVLLIIDQFEELYSPNVFAQRTVIKSLLDLLKKQILPDHNQALPCRLLLSYRADFTSHVINSFGDLLNQHGKLFWLMLVNR